MRNFGVVYESHIIWKALDIPSLRRGYELVGLIFERNENATTKLEQLTFVVKALYYSFAEGFTSITLSTMPDSLATDRPHVQPKGFVFGGASSGDFSLTDMIVSTDPDIEGRLQDGNYEFWNAATVSADSLVQISAEDVMPGFVLFGKARLKAISINPENFIIISGAVVNYGHGVFNYASPNNSRNYKSLKAESTPRINDNRLLPNTLKGLPCPPYWGDDTIASETGIILTSENQEQFSRHLRDFYADYDTETNESFNKKI